MANESTDFSQIVNSSGFPFQIAVEQLIHATEAAHNWKVLYREHGWMLGEQSGFMDLVLSHNGGSRYLVVECKRLKDAAWVFLPADGNPRPRRHANAFVSWYDGGRQPIFSWCDLAADPPSPESPFCAMRGQDSSGQRSLLERVGGELVASTEALARELRDFRDGRMPDLKLYASAIITNVTLRVARFTGDHLSLTDGAIEGAEFLEVPWVRFRKQLAAKAHLLTPDDYTRATAQGRAVARENTIFVVNVLSVMEFLRAFSYDHGPLAAMGVT